MVAVLVGAVFIGLGIWGIVHWFHEFLIALKGFVPISILIGGVVSLITGLATFQTRAINDKSEK